MLEWPFVPIHLDKCNKFVCTSGLNSEHRLLSALEIGDQGKQVSICGFWRGFSSSADVHLLDESLSEENKQDFGPVAPMPCMRAPPLRPNHPPKPHLQMPSLGGLDFNIWMIIYHWFMLFQGHFHNLVFSLLPRLYISLHTLFSASLSSSPKSYYPVTVFSLAVHSPLITLTDSLVFFSPDAEQSWHRLRNIVL